MIFSCLVALPNWTRADDWPQWRGPERTNVSKETGLLKEWPESGPPLVWKAEGLGDGVASAAVAGGRIFTVGSRGEDEFAFAFDAATGKKLWEKKIGGKFPPQMSIMRWLSQRVPTVDGEHVYFVSGNAELFCFDSATGKELWQKSYDKDFEGKSGVWGCCDHPLVDGERLIITPGGNTATIAALNKITGEVIWKAAVPDDHVRSYSTLIVAEICGVRQYINHLSRSLVAVAAKDGKPLWSYNGLSNGTANTHAPIVRGDEVFYANGYGGGITLLQIARTDGKFQVTEVYRIRKNLQAWLGSPVALGEHVYVNFGAGVFCVEWKTGKEIWSGRLGGGNHTPTCADGRLYVRDGAGKVFLVEAAPDAFKVTGRFAVERQSANEPTYTFPVVSGGRLYLRDQNVLWCYEVAAKKEQREEKKQPTGGVFVPTPPDIVEKMLDLATVKKGELVCDLGCGDGRILVAAAKRFGARGYGIDIDSECVKLAREAVVEAKVGDLVTIEKGDLFDADFSKADVLALYLVPATLQKLIPKFEKLKPGVRIVTHVFPIPGLKPDKVVSVSSSEDEQERKLYLWTVPLNKAE
jgi:outer membrane protein assembly factor BamB/protein-L-isoaspartate O-methyltransferase